jgi:hypothetical protein
MKKYMIAFVVLAGSFLFAEGQTKKKVANQNKFTSMLQLGILEGQADKSYGQLQLVNGIQKNAWFYGLGLGIDYYASKRSIPLFVDIRRDFKKGKKAPFIYADAGYNFSWLRDKDKINFWGGDYKQQGGMYYEAGLGYRFVLKNNMSMGFSGGYSFKHQKETGTRFLWNDFPTFPQPSTNQQPDVYDYKFRRICFKLNCSF